ncbi:MAG: transposase family protein [Bacteroidales bacterium]
MQLTIPEIIKVFSITRPQAYRLVKKMNWDFNYRNLETGGREAVYDVPTEEIPSFNETEICVAKTEKSKKAKNTTFLKNESENDIQKAEKENFLPKIINESFENDIPDLVPEEIIAEEELKKAQLKASFCDEIIRRLDLSKPKMRTALWTALTEAYNSGLLASELFNIEGTRCERTLKSWVKEYQDSGCSYQIFIRKPVSNNIKFATDIEQNYLLYLLLDTNRIKIGSAIRKLKQLSRLGIIESPTSERALRRWCEDWKKEHIQQWNLLRHGNKHLKDNGLLSIIRENCLRVGDVWVADGHKLAFDIVDPKSGKPKRMTLILFFDWASRYPVGASIANTEDSEHILLALRNGIMNWGARPRFVYLDNGRAFKAKLFHEKWEEHDLEKELCGIFPRLDIQAVFAQAYNARAKVVERFFKTFQEDFERFMDTFRGAGIEDKPAHLMRNEKWIKNLKDRKPLELEESKILISAYFQEFYGKTPHLGLNGHQPFEVFKTSEIPEDRKIDFKELNFLMLKIQSRVVGKEGIRLNNALFWHEKIVPFIGQEVRLRYDIMDMRSILVYDLKDNLVCQAVLRGVTHPFVKLAENQELAEKELKNQIKQQKRLEKDIKEKSALIRKQVEESVANISMPRFNINNTSFNNAPLLEQTSSISANPELDKLNYDLEQIPISNKEKSKEEKALANFDELLKTIGID